MWIWKRIISVLLQSNRSISCNSIGDFIATNTDWKTNAITHYETLNPDSLHIITETSKNHVT